mgnify:CR=1 FL=1
MSWLLTSSTKSLPPLPAASSVFALLPLAWLSSWAPPSRAALKTSALSARAPCSLLNSTWSQTAPSLKSTRWSTNSAPLCSPPTPLNAKLLVSSVFNTLWLIWTTTALKLSALPSSSALAFANSWTRLAFAQLLAPSALCARLLLNGVRMSSSPFKSRPLSSRLLTRFAMFCPSLGLPTALNSLLVSCPNSWLNSLPTTPPTPSAVLLLSAKLCPLPGFYHSSWSRISDNALQYFVALQ